MNIPGRKRSDGTMSTGRKFLFFLALVLLPAVAVGISNYSVFPESYWIATIMLLITVIVAGLFTWHARNATVKTWKYVTVAHLFLCTVLCANLICHWILAREVNAARDAVTARHTEEDRAHRMQLELAGAERELLRQQGQNNRHLPFTARRNPVFQSPTGERLSSVGTGTTEEDVKGRWWWWLTYLAIAEVFAAVVLGAILMCVWEWDRNKDGIADHLQRDDLGPIQSAVANRQVGFRSGPGPARIPATSQGDDPKS